MPRVLLISDTAKPIGDLRAALEDSGHEVVDVVDGVRALLHAVEAHRPDVVILDVDSPSRDALEQLAMLHRHAPRPVVVFSASGDSLLPSLRVSAARWSSPSGIRDWYMCHSTRSGRAHSGPNTSTAP